MSREYQRIGCGGQCPVNGIDESSIGFIPNKNKLISVNGSVKVAKGIKKKYDTGIVYLSPYWSFDGYNNLCPSASPGCRSTCLVTSGQLKNPTPKQSQLDKTNFWLSDPNGFLSQAHKEIESLVRTHSKPGSNKFCIRLNGTSDIPFETKSYTYKGVQYKSIMEAFPNVQFYDYTKIYGRLGKTPKNYHLTFSASETNTEQWEKALERGFQVAMVFGSLPGKVKKATGEYIRKPDPLPKTYHGFKVVDGDDTDLTFLRPKGVIIGLRMKGKAENDVTGFVKRDYAQVNKKYPKLNPKTNVPNIISPRGVKPKKPKVTIGCNDEFIDGEPDGTYVTSDDLYQHYKSYIVKKDGNKWRIVKTYDYPYQAVQDRLNYNPNIYKIHHSFNDNKSMPKFEKGSKEAKAYMAKLRAMKNNGSGLSGLDKINRGKTTTYIHYSNSGIKKRVAKKSTSSRSATKKVERRTTISLSSLNIGDTFTIGTSTKIYERASKVPNQNKYYVTDLAGKEYVFPGTKKVYLEGEAGISGYVHTKRYGKKTIVKYTRSTPSKVSGIPDAMGAVNVAIDDVKKHSDLIKYYQDHIDSTKDYLKANGRSMTLRSKMDLRKDIAKHMKTIAHHKKMLSQAKKMIK